MEKEDYVKKMASMLLKGAVMLAETCPQCGAPLFEYNEEKICPRCGAISSDLTETKEKIIKGKTDENIDVLKNKVLRLTNALLDNLLSKENIKFTSIRENIEILGLLIEILAKLNNI